MVRLRIESKQLVHIDNAGMKFTHGTLQFTAKMKNIAEMQPSLPPFSVITVLYMEEFSHAAVNCQ